MKGEVGTGWDRSEQVRSGKDRTGQARSEQFSHHHNNIIVKFVGLQI